LKILSENQYRCSVFSCDPSTIYYDSRWIANIRLRDQQEYIADTSELTILALFRSAPTLLKWKVIKSRTLRSFFHIANKSQDSYQHLTFPNNVADYEVNTWINEASRDSFADRKTFKFIHLCGAHRPYAMDENCMPTSLFGIKSSGKQQALGSLRITRNLLELMKESDVYDQSLIIVMADHGLTTAVPEYYPEVLQDPSLSLRPIFLIKKKHSQQSEMTRNDNPIHISDTTPIILSELGLLQGEDAFSPFEMPESLVEERMQKWDSIWNNTTTK